MHIVAATIAATSTHSAQRTVREEERLEISGTAAGLPRTGGGGGGAVEAQALIDRLERQPRSGDPGVYTRSAVGRQQSGPDTAATQNPLELSEEQHTTVMILERLFGIRGLRDRLQATHEGFRVRSLSVTIAAETTAAADGPVGWGVAYDLSREITDHEATTVSFSGSLHTADGRAIDLQFTATDERLTVSHESFSLRAGDAIDPLVLDLGGTGIGFSGQRVDFDLTADGNLENLPAFAHGNYLLALDRNDDGRIDDGRELFGPSTGNGFAELARFDSDGNGFIDHGDPIFDRLQLLRLDADGAESWSLDERGVGAIALGAVESPFSHRSADGQANLAQVRASAFFLYEDGRPGLMQQVDLFA